MSAVPHTNRFSARRVVQHAGLQRKPVSQAERQPAQRVVEATFHAAESGRWMSLPLTLFLILAISPCAEAAPTAATLAGWRAYEAQIDARYNAAVSGPAAFFVLDRETQARGWRESVLRGEPALIKVEAPAVEDGKIHHWIGAIFVPGMTV